MIYISRNLDRLDRGNNNRSQSPGSDAKPPSDYRGWSTLESYTLRSTRVRVCTHTYTRARARSFGSQLFTIIYIYIYVPGEVLTTGQRKCLDSVTPHYRGHPSRRHPSFPLCRIAWYGCYVYPVYSSVRER